MPLWTIYHPDNTFTSQQEKDDLASSITETYSTIPAFYVVVVFVAVPATSYYRSGKTINNQEKPFIRLVVHHLARQARDNPEGLEAGFSRGRFMVESSIQEHIIEKGYSWEYTVLEEDRNLWRIDGLEPPEYQSEAMNLWRRLDKAVPYDE